MPITIILPGKVLGLLIGADPNKPVNDLNMNVIRFDNRLFLCSNSCSFHSYSSTNYSIDNTKWLIKIPYQELDEYGRNISYNLSFLDLLTTNTIFSVLIGIRKFAICERSGVTQKSPTHKS